MLPIPSIASSMIGLADSRSGAAGSALTEGTIVLLGATRGIAADVVTRMGIQRTAIAANNFRFAMTGPR